MRTLNKRACEALIASGALDSFGGRAQLLAGLDAAYGEVLARQEEAETGQTSLFGEAGGSAQRPSPDLPTVPEWGERERLAREKEALGFYISGHPLDRWRNVALVFDEAGAQALKNKLGQTVELACVVTAVARQVSRRDGAEWAKITVEGFAGTATVLAFRDSWRSHRELLEPDAVVLLRGKVSDRERDEDDPPVFLDGAEPMDRVPDSGRLAVRIALARGARLPDDAFAKARALVTENPGAPRWRSWWKRATQTVERGCGLARSRCRPSARRCGRWKGSSGRERWRWCERSSKNTDAASRTRGHSP